MKRFPIITDQSRIPREVRRSWPTSVPWSFVEPARAQAKRNHDQSLERLASRGGLGPQELWLALHGQGLFKNRQQVAVPDETACGEWLIAAMRQIGDIQ